MLGFDLLRTRAFNERIDIDEIFEKYGFETPPLYRLFLESFEWKYDLIEDDYFFYVPDLQLGDITFPYLSFEEALISSVDTGDEEIEEHQWIFVANSTYGIFLGTQGSEKDKIIARTASVEGEYKVIADNIFVFLRGISDNLISYARSEEELRTYLVSWGEDEEGIVEKLLEWRKQKEE